MLSGNAGMWLHCWCFEVPFSLIGLSVSKYFYLPDFENFALCIDGVMQDCSNSIANMLELLQSYNQYISMMG